MIGLGSMGSGMARALLDAGWQVRGYDPATSATRHAAKLGVEVVTNPAAAAGQYVVLSLPSASAVRQVMEELLAAPGIDVVLDTTTSDPGTSRELAELSARQGVAFLDAPVSGGKSGAAAGELMAFVGGNEVSVTRAKPLLDVLARGRWRRMGPAGAGNVVKLINNSMAATHLVVATEALEIATSYGLEPDVVLAALNVASGRSGATEINYPKWILPGTYDSGFALGLMERDIRLAVQVAHDAGVSPTLLDTGAKAWQTALSDLGHEADFNRAIHAFKTQDSAAAPVSAEDTVGITR